MNFGKRLKKAIKSLGMTYTAFAQAIGVPRESVSQWTLGKQNPLFKNLVAMYEHFGINPGFLLTGQGPMFLRNRAVVSLQEEMALQQRHGQLLEFLEGRHKGTSISVALWHVYMGLVYDKNVPRRFLEIWSRLIELEAELLLDLTSLTVSESEVHLDEDTSELSSEDFTYFREVSLSLLQLGVAEKLPWLCFLHDRAYWTQCPECRSLGI